MNKFYGRENELEILESQWSKDEFTFGVLYGRRRVGKTFLLNQFLKDKKDIYLQATEDKQYNLQKLSKSIGKTFFGTEDIVTIASFSSAFEIIAEKAKDERIAFVIDEVSYLDRSDNKFLSVLQSFVDNDFQSTKLFLVLCGSNRSFIENNVLGLGSPLYGRRTFQIKLQPFFINETARMFDSWNVNDIAAAHVLSGGIPYYLSFIKSHKDIAGVIREEFFSLGGRLYTEARLYLMTDFRNIELYDKILELIASGVNEVSKIADKSGKDKSSISQALQKLFDSGIVQPRKQIANKGLNRGWVFTDTYFYFFYKYVFPFSEVIEIGSGDSAYSFAAKSLLSFIGHAIEDSFHKYVIKNFSSSIIEIGNLEFPNPETRTNEEIDLVARTTDNVFIFGEVKWRSEPTGIDVYKGLVYRSTLAYPEITERKFVILSRSGFTDELIQQSTIKANNLLLITGEDFIK